MEGNRQGNNLVRTIKGHGRNNSWSTPLFGVLSNDFLVTCSNDRHLLMVHDPTDGKKIKSVQTEQGGAQSLLVLSNNQVAIGFNDRSIRIYDLEGGETRAVDRSRKSNGLLLDENPVTSLFQLSNGNLVSSGKDGDNVTIKVWNLADLSLLQRIETDHRHLITSMGVSMDETFLATGSMDLSVKIWPIQ